LHSSGTITLGTRSIGDDPDAIQRSPIIFVLSDAGEFDQSGLMWSTLLLNVPDYLIDRIYQGGNVASANVVDGFGIHIKIVVTDDVSQPHCFLPLDLGIFGKHLIAVILSNINGLVVDSTLQKRIHLFPVAHDIYRAVKLFLKILFDSDQIKQILPIQFNNDIDIALIR
jgi:uncharacterized membrane protein